MQIKNNVIALAKGASILGIPVVLTTISTETNGPMIREITDLFPEVKIINRNIPSFDAFDDLVIKEEIKKAARKQLVISGLWTSMCLSFTTQHAIEEGYEVFGVMDATGSESLDAYNMAVNRMMMAGVIPCTWMQTVSEWMDNWLHPKAGEMYTNVYVPFSKGNPFFDKSIPGIK